MSYQSALESAGAVVHAYEEFGSYQGDWYAKVTHNGVTGWVSGSFGSCSGCDAWEAEFDTGCLFEEETFEKWLSEGAWSIYAHDDKPASVATDTPEWRAWWQSKRAEFLEKVRAFGAGYLESIQTQAEAEAEVSKYADWDSEAPNMLKFLRDNAITEGSR